MPKSEPRWWNQPLGSGVISAIVGAVSGALLGAWFGYSGSQLGVENRLGEYKARIDTLERQSAAMPDTVSSLGDRLIAAESHMTAVSAHVTTLTQDVVALATRMAALEEGSRAECADLMKKAITPPGGGMVVGYTDQNGVWRTQTDDARDAFVKLYNDLGCTGITGPIRVP